MLIFVKVWRKFAGVINATTIECCSFCENYFYICGVERLTARRQNIYESVFAVLKWKCGSFLRIKGERIALISCIAMWLYAFCVPTPILSKCGALYRLFDSGFTTTSILINGNQLHTFFLYNPPYRSCYGRKTM